MPEYQLVPYTVQVNVRGKPDEFRPLDDLDGSRLGLLDVMAEIAVAHVGKPRMRSTEDTRQIEISEVHRGLNSLMVVAEAGRKGVYRRVLQQRSGQQNVVEVREDDVTSTPLRHVVVVNSHSTVGLLIAERAGIEGAVTLLWQLLKSQIAERFGGLVLEMAPAMSQDVMKSWAKQAKVKGIELKRVEAKTGYEVHGLNAVPSFTVVPPKRRSWSLKQFGGWSGLSQVQIIELLVPTLPGNADQGTAHEAAVALIEEGWRASVVLNNGGKQRKLQVDTKAGITLTFPAGSESGRSSSEEFLTSCQGVVAQLKELPGLASLSPGSCLWGDEVFVGEGSWKGVWGVSPPDLGAGAD